MIYKETFYETKEFSYSKNKKHGNIRGFSFFTNRKFSKLDSELRLQEFPQFMKF